MCCFVILSEPLTDRDIYHRMGPVVLASSSRNHCRDQSYNEICHVITNFSVYGNHKVNSIERESESEIIAESIPDLVLDYSSLQSRHHHHHQLALVLLHSLSHFGCLSIDCSLRQWRWDCTGVIRRLWLAFVDDGSRDCVGVDRTCVVAAYCVDCDHVSLSKHIIIRHKNG